jgi:hypothetical protein
MMRFSLDYLPRQVVMLGKKEPQMSRLGKVRRSGAFGCV